MAGCTRRRPACLIDVPAGCKTGFYYFSINNIPAADVKTFSGRWLKNTITESQQFHHYARTGWIRLKSWKQFINAIEELERAKVCQPRLEFSQANGYCSIKIEVLNPLVTQRAILKHLRGNQPVLSQNPRRTRRLEPNLYPRAVASSVNIIIAGVSVPKLQDLRRWVLESLGSYCLMAAISRLVNIGGSQQRLTRCTLNSRCGLPANKVLSSLRQHWVGSEDAIISVEPEDIGTHRVVETVKKCIIRLQRP